MNSSPLEITLLVDDQAHDELEAEHGLALLVETAGHRILMDTGMGGALPGNAAKLGIDLGTVETLVLSHGHYDHTGGLPQVLASRPDIDVYFHPSVFAPRYTVSGNGAREIGMPAGSLQAMKQLADRQLHPVTANLSLWDNIGVIAPIARETSFEDPGGPFFLDAEATKPDPIEDDLAMWIRTDEGLLLLVGCCHAGLINTVTHVQRATGESRIRAIVGGLHLLHADSGRLDPTLAALKTIAPEHLMPCHCTGDHAVGALADAFGERVQVGTAGAVWRF